MTSIPKISVAGRQLDCELVIFDMDGTLIDERPRFLNLAKARAKIMKEILGDDSIAVWSRLSGVDLKSGKVDMDGPLARASRKEDLAVAAASIYLGGKRWSEARSLAERIYNAADELTASTRRESLLPGVEDALKRLKRAGLKLAVATNERRTAAEKITETVGVRDLFDAFVGADEVENPKPAADMILLACERCGCPPSETVLAGDQPADLSAGRGACLKAVIAVRSDSVPITEIEGLSDTIIDSVIEIKPL